MKTNKSVSKFLSLVLRHKPETIGIELDPNGWVEIDELIDALAKHGKYPMDHNMLEEIVATNDKKRFAFNSTGTHIRANQGHSINVDLALKPQIPPVRLYHGTSELNLPNIMKEGLKKMNRDHVHLSEDFYTAEKVGMRQKGVTVILDIDSKSMFLAGGVFYKSENGVWLTDYVDPKYIS
jgi:putative RNA 2'-phosphotransferase